MISNDELPANGPHK